MGGPDTVGGDPEPILQEVFCIDCSKQQHTVWVSKQTDEGNLASSRYHT